MKERLQYKHLEKIWVCHRPEGLQVGTGPGLPVATIHATVAGRDPAYRK